MADGIPLSGLMGQLDSEREHNRQQAERIRALEEGKERGHRQREKYEERIRALEAAIREHRDQKADDRCWEDDQRLYAVLGDGNPGDNRVGDKVAMLENCRRFIERRCAGGAWPTYAQLEAALWEAAGALACVRDCTADDCGCGRCKEASGSAAARARAVLAVPGEKTKGETT